MALLIVCILALGKTFKGLYKTGLGGSCSALLSNKAGFEKYPELDRVFLPEMTELARCRFSFLKVD